MLAWFAWLWFNPGPSPYRYQLVEEGGVDKFSQLGLDAWPDLTIAKYDVFAEDIRRHRHNGPCSTARPLLPVPATGGWR